MATRRETAEHFGVGEGVISRWIARGAPRPVDGVYDLKALAQWVNAYVVPAERDRARYAKARADLAEHKLEQDRARFHDATECRRATLKKFELVRRHFDYLPNEIATKAVGTDNPRAFSVLIYDEARALLNRLADGKPPRRPRSLLDG